jgi:hypothetical protein
MTPRLFYWLPSAVFLAHMVEEFPTFPAWATRHFGVTTRPFYVYSHIPLTATLLGISFAATRDAGTTWQLLATASQWVLFTNALFHIATTVLFREYSPGVVTGIALFLPSTVYLLNRTWSEHLLTGEQLCSAVLLGTVVGALVVASLWLNLGFDWRLARVTKTAALEPESR